MAVSLEYVKQFLKEKCMITLAFFGEVIFELVRVSIVMAGVQAFLIIANWMGLGNNVYVEMLHQFSVIGFSIIYLIVLVYGIIDFYRIFNKPTRHDSIQTNLDEVGEKDGT